MRAYKIVLILVVALFSLTTIGAEYTMEEIQKHDNEKSCWIVINDSVYDVTSFLEKHPAPKVVLKKACGKESTKDFETKKGLGEKHSAKALEGKEKFKIGTVLKTK